MEPFYFAVGLGPAGSGLLDLGAGSGAGSMPQPGFIATAVVGDNPLRGDPDGDIPGGGASPESGCGGGFLVVQDLRIGDAGTVVDGGVDVPVPGIAAPGRLLAVVAASPGSPSAPVGDPGQLFDVDMDQLTRRVALIPFRWWFIGGSVASIQPTQPGTAQDVVHRGGSQPDLEPDVVCTPPSLLP